MLIYLENLSQKKLFYQTFTLAVCGVSNSKWIYVLHHTIIYRKTE